MVEKFTTTRILHYQVNTVLVLNDFIEFDEVWVVNLFENFDFADNSINIGLLANARFLKHFDGDIVAFRLVSSKLHATESPFA